MPGHKSFQIMDLDHLPKWNFDPKEAQEAKEIKQGLRVSSFSARELRGGAGGLFPSRGC